MEERKPAPGGLSLIEDFINTKHDGDDHVATPAALAAWLTERGLARPGTTAGAEDVARAAAVREALRHMLLEHNGGPPAGSAVTRLNEFAARVPFVLTFTGAAGAQLAPAASGIDAALAEILRTVLGAMADGRWARLKACRSDTCRWAFYDSSRNHSAAWCSMQSCGNRHKARAYRTRRRATRADEH